MLTCKEAHALISHAVEGRIALRVFDPLRQHLSVCPDCREALDTQRQVKQALAARVPESLPAGFSARLAARLDAESHRLPVGAPVPIVRELTLLASPPERASWRDRSAWRTWSLRLLPIAAALVLFVWGARSSDSGRTRGDAPGPEAAFAGSDERMLEWLARPNTPLDSLLVALAKGPAPVRPFSGQPSGQPSDGSSAGGNPTNSGNRAEPATLAQSASSTSSTPIAGSSTAQTMGEPRQPDERRSPSGQAFAAPGVTSDASDPRAPRSSSAPGGQVASTMGADANGRIVSGANAHAGAGSIAGVHAGAAAGAGTVAGTGGIANGVASGAVAGGANGRPGLMTAAPAGSRAAAGSASAPAPADAWPAPAPLAANAGGLPGTVVPNAVPTALAGQMAQELRLTDAQRKQIEAIYDAQRQKLSEILESNRQRLTLERRETDEAVEKVLTPRQRQRYRDMNANRGPALPLNDPALPPPVLPNGLELTITPPPPPFR